MKGSTVYVTVRPCKACVLQMAGHGVKRIVYFNNGEPGLEWPTIEEIARLSSMHLSKFAGNLNWMRDRLKWMESIGVFD